MIRGISRLTKSIFEHPSNIYYLPLLAKNWGKDILSTENTFMTYQAETFLEELLNKKMTILEFGSGASTKFFSKRVKKVYTVETDKEWAKKIKKLELKNVDLLFSKGNKRFIEIGKKYGPKADLVLIDSYKLREDAARAIMPFIKEKCIVILDDTNFERYKSAKEFVEQNLAAIKIFRGLKNGTTINSETSFYIMKTKDKKIQKSIIIPAYNEEKGIQEVIRRCKKVINKGDEIIVVDDGSRDKTAEVARKEKIWVISYKKNKGKAGALKEGFRKAKNKVIVTIDADCTYPPEKIPDLADEIRRADLVVGTRFRGMWPEDMPWHRVMANKLGALATSVILKKKVTDVTTGLRAFKKDLINGMNIKAKGLDFEAEFTAKAISKGFIYKEIKIEAEEREGKSSLNFFKDMWRFFKAVLRGKYSN